jgi:hypothetical protein
MKIPLYPDLKQTSDVSDATYEHFMFHFNKRLKEFGERANKIINIAKASQQRKKTRKPLGEIKSEDLSKQNEIVVDEKTGLIFGMGFDDYITRDNATEEQLKEESQLQALVDKLGYMDFRDFVALNKYIIEASEHESLVNRTKAKFLMMAMQKLSSARKDELKKTFKKLDEKNRDLSVEEKNDSKIEFIFDNITGGKELFYDYYYTLKEMNQRDDAKTENEFEKYNSIKFALNDPKNRKCDRDGLYKSIDSNLKYNLNDHMELIIKTYRAQRTVLLENDSKSIIEKLQVVMRKLTEFPFLKVEENLGEIIELCKYQTFLNRYRQVYKPTNLETERLINRYLREKRLKDFTKEKMMEEGDPYFSPLSDEDDLEIQNLYYDKSNINNININDEELKLMKEKYYEAKYKYQKKKLEASIDKALADDLGFVITDQGQTHKLKDIDEYDQISYLGLNPMPTFMQTFLDQHYKSFKLDFMYNYLDYFSNKYRVRRRIAYELKNKVDLKEINYILNSLVCVTKTNNTGRKEINKPINYYNVNDFIMATYGQVKPSYIQTLTECSTGVFAFDTL